MRIGIVGAGAVGGYFGGRLAAAGSDVTFIVRERTAARLRQDGLAIVSPLGDVALPPTMNVLGPNEAAAPFDLVLLAVKMYDLAEAAMGLRPFVNPQTAVVPVQNGVEAHEMVLTALPGIPVHAGTAHIFATLEAPGRIHHRGGFAKLLFGPVHGAPPAPLVNLEQAFRRAAVDGVLAPDITLQIWRKFIFLAPFAAITCYAGNAIGPIREDPALWDRYAALVAETVAVARAKGVALPEDAAHDRLEFTRTLPADMRASMLADLEAGRPLELDWLTGAVIRLGKETGTPVPVSEATASAIRERASGGKGAG